MSYHRKIPAFRASGLSPLLAITLLATACSGLEIIPDAGIEKPVSVITGKRDGIKLSDFNKKETSGIDMPVNALLWRAALDIVSIVPLDDVDTFGGSIITEWHQSAGNPDERLKLSVFVQGRELRSDAVKVQTYIQKRSGNDWVDSGSDKELATKLEGLILTRARELRSTTVSETTQ